MLKSGSRLNISFSDTVVVFIVAAVVIDGKDVFGNRISNKVGALVIDMDCPGSLFGELVVKTNCFVVACVSRRDFLVETVERNGLLVGVEGTKGFLVGFLEVIFSGAFVVKNGLIGVGLEGLKGFLVGFVVTGALVGLKGLKGFLVGLEKGFFVGFVEGFLVNLVAGVVASDVGFVRNIPGLGLYTGNSSSYLASVSLRKLDPGGFVG